MDGRGTVAFVTGASRGIGRIISEALANDGASVAGFARPSEHLDSLRSRGVSAHPLDVTDPTMVERAFTDAVTEVGRPTLLVTCAGSADALGPLADADPETWWRAVEVDLRGTMLCARTALTWMLPAGAGRIVTVYGNLGDDGSEHVSAFAVAKAGIARMTETLATELAGTGVVALSMHPGFVRTSMTEHLATSASGQRWLPWFGERAHDHWGDGAAAVSLIRSIIAGDGDALAGRVVHVGDDLVELSRSCVDEGCRHLRVQPG